MILSTLSTSRLAICSKVIYNDVLVNDLWWWFEISLRLHNLRILSSQGGFTSLFGIVCSNLCVGSICGLIIDALESLSPTTCIPTVLSSLQLSPSSPYSLETDAHILYLSHTPDHVRDLEMRPCIMAKVFGLWSIISLPAVTEGVIHAIICEIVILEIKVVKIVSARLNLLTLQHTDQLSFCLFKSYHHFSIFSQE